MLLDKLELNRRALMQIGEKAVLRGRELGLMPSCADLGVRDAPKIQVGDDGRDDSPAAKGVKR